MFVHIVFWKLLDVGGNGRTREDNARELKRQFEAMRGQVPGLRRLDFNSDELRTDESADVALYTEFDSRAAYESYVVHPLHKDVVAFFKGLRSERRVVDYEI
jgi:hypothetical protein